MVINMKDVEEYMDDSVDIGKDPLPIENAEAQKVHDELLKEFGMSKAS